MLCLVDAIGGPILHTKLVELSLNDLHDFCILRVLLRDIHMQGALLNELLIQCLLLDEVVKLLVERVIEREAIVGIA